MRNKCIFILERYCQIIFWVIWQSKSGCAQTIMIALSFGKRFCELQQPIVTVMLFLFPILNHQSFVFSRCLLHGSVGKVCVFFCTYLKVYRRKICFLSGIGEYQDNTTHYFFSTVFSKQRLQLEWQKKSLSNFNDCTHINSWFFITFFSIPNPFL